MASKPEALAGKNVNWNFSVNVLENMFYVLAISLVSRETIMPLLVGRLTDSTIAIGLIRAIFSLSFLLPQLFVANHAERMKRKLPFVLLLSGLLQRLPYPVIGLALLLFAIDAPGLALAIFFIGIATAAFGGGVVTPAWFTMIGKVVPVRRRGIFFGLADGGGMFMGLVGAYFVALILEHVDFPGNFSLLFLAASVPLAISWIWLALTREPESEDTKPAIPLSHYFKQLPGVLRRHANYRHFLISYALLHLSMMAVSFYIVFADQPTFIGLTNTFIAPVTFVGPILGGWIAATFSLDMLFAVSLVCGIIGGMLLLLWVREPRNTGKQMTKRQELA